CQAVPPISILRKPPAASLLVRVPSDTRQVEVRSMAVKHGPVISPKCKHILAPAAKGNVFPRVQVQGSPTRVASREKGVYAIGKVEIIAGERVLCILSRVIQEVE